MVFMRQPFYRGVPGWVAQCGSVRPPHRKRRSGASGGPSVRAALRAASQALQYDNVTFLPHVLWIFGMNANKINALKAFFPDNPRRPVMINRKFCFRTVTSGNDFGAPPCRPVA